MNFRGCSGCVKHQSLCLTRRVHCSWIWLYISTKVGRLTASSITKHYRWMNALLAIKEYQQTHKFFRGTAFFLATSRFSCSARLLLFRYFASISESFSSRSYLRFTRDRFLIAICCVCSICPSILIERGFLNIKPPFV